MRWFISFAIALIGAGGVIQPAFGLGGGTNTAVVSGVVTDSLGRPLSNAQVLLSPGGRGTTTNSAGAFNFRSVPPGRYHLDVSLIGYAPAHASITVAADGEPVMVEIQLHASPLALEGVMVTGTPGASDPLTVARSATQISGRQFDRQLSATVAGMLEHEPGISARYSGPATSAPVIRGLTGERVVMLENGQRTGDLSGSAPDHALSVDPLSATRIEVVRGPASLLYGSGAIGGVVNVIGTDISGHVPSRVEGYVAAQGMTVTPGGAATAQLLVPLSERVVLSGRGGVRRLDDVRIGGGDVLDNSFFNNATANLGLGYVSGRLSGGVAVNAHQFDYGVPFGHSHGPADADHDHDHDHDHGEHAGVDLQGERYDVRVQGGWDPPGTTIRRVDFSGSGQWYEHDEIESDGSIGTTFTLRTQTLDLRADTDLGHLRGTVGLSGLLKQYEPTGEEALTPFARSGNLGLFIFQEMPLVPGAHDSEFVPHLQLGGRYDLYDISTETSDDFGPGRDRTFRAFSGSLGVNFPLPQGVSLGASVSRAFRAPSVEELFSGALHAATGSYDVGNPDLNPEVSVGVEGIVRAHTSSLNALVSAYHNRLSDYIAPEIVGDTTLVDDHGSFTVPLNRFRQEDATLTGVEGKVEVRAGESLVVGVRGDRVRGRFASGAPLPYMPAARVGGEVRWDDGRFNVGIDALHAFAQRDVPQHEFATDDYTLLNVGAGFSRSAGGLIHNVSLRVENLADVVYREATSRIKELAPNPGRNVSLVYRVLF